MHFLYSVCYELTAFTYFEHYLPIFRRRYTNNHLNKKSASLWFYYTDVLRDVNPRRLLNINTFVRTLCVCVCVCARAPCICSSSLVGAITSSNHGVNSFDVWTLEFVWRYMFGNSLTHVLTFKKTERRPLHLKAQSVPRCKHFSSRL
jgi:hypothetical protein